MVISQGVDMREKLRNLSIINLMFICLWFEKDDTNGALTIGRGNTSRTTREAPLISMNRRFLYMTCPYQIVYKYWTILL